MTEITLHTAKAITAKDRIKAYMELLKLRLSFLIAFSSGFGYALGATDFSWTILGWLFIGGLLVSGASVTINQILEKDLDKLMRRTQNRPLPTNRISLYEAKIFAGSVAFIGLGILAITTNWLTVALSILSLILYSFVYTPLKRVGPIAVFVGAIPGALPPLLGWVAATGHISTAALVIFGLQFIWQFPHFWAIAWVADEDYKKAGFKLLPAGGKKDLNTAFQIMIYTLVLLPLGVLPSQFGITGLYSAFVVTLCGALFFAQTFYLMKQCLIGEERSYKAARSIMFGSFIYLPVVQIALILDKV